VGIQQVVPFSIILVGDGVTTTFKYTPSQLFAVNFAGPNYRTIYSAATPSAVTAMSSTLGHVTASLSSGKIQLIFSTPPPNGLQAEVNINLFFVSQ